MVCAKITDRNGNYATVAYNTSSAYPEITSVTASDGRTISFVYTGSGTAGRRVTSISSSGKTYSYGYVSIPGVVDKYQLTSVTRPGGTTWNYAYNGNLNPPGVDSNAGSHLMSAMTFPQGGSHSYSYGYVYFDSQANPSSRSTVVTGKARSAGGNWTFAYTPGSVGGYDTTTVSTPTGTITYQHIGPNYSSSGTVWMVGLLMSKTTGGVQSETYTWAKQKIGSENNSRPGAFVTKIDAGEVNAPVLTQKTIDRDGATYTTTYNGFDVYGNPSSMTETGTSGGNRTTTLSYYIDTAKWIVKQVQNESFLGGATNRTFNANGNLTAITRDGVTTSFAYDVQGNVATATFPRLLTHSYSNYKRGIPQTESQPEGISIARVVSDAGNVTSETNGEGKTTFYGYDGLDRITSVAYPVGAGVSVSYGAATMTAVRGGVLAQTITYNGFGNPVAVNLGGVVRSFTVDALGRPIFESYPGSSYGVARQYDMLDRVTRVTNTADSTYSTITYSAGAKTVVDELGRSTGYTYRAYGNPDQQVLMAIAAADVSANMSYTRNARDLITSATQAGLTRSYGYNSNYYLTSASNPETGLTTYGRDAAGNMTSRTVGASNTATFVYDNQNRVIAKNYAAPTPSVALTYNRVHKLLTANSPTGNRSFSYDGSGNLTNETLVVDGYTFGASYTYNGLDQLSAVTYPVSGLVVNYAPDALGRPTQASGFVTGVSYWPNNQIQKITYANGTMTTYDQDARQRVSTFKTAKSDGSATYIDSTYSYDAVGNLATDTGAGGGYRFYDVLDRVTTGFGAPWGSGSLTYDGAGNITFQSRAPRYSSLRYVYDASNRLTSVIQTLVSGQTTRPYAYDSYGNVISNGISTFTYDDTPNLRRVDAVNSTGYAYDGVNLRSMVTINGVKMYEMHSTKGVQLIEYSPANSNRLIEHIYLGAKHVAQRVTP